MLVSKNVITAEGNVRKFKRVSFTKLNQKDGTLIYISGETISIDLDQQLLKEGYNIKRIINYRTIHNQNFDDEFVNQLKLKMPDMVYVYSPK